MDIVINTELVIFNKNNTKTQVIRRIENIEPDKLYEFKFLIDAKTKNSFENIYTIYVRLNNKNGEIISREKINFNDYNGEKVVSIKTTIDTEYISLLFNCRNVDQSEYLKIKSLSMNGKEITLDYKILPYKLIERIKNISLDSKSLYERTTMIKDSFKILNKNWIVGQGKDTWKLFYSEIKSYNYYAVQLHCYPMNIWIEYGIIPLCVFIYLVLLVIKRLIFKSKNNKAENIGMLLAILLLVFHSILDFDLDFVNMMCILFIMIGCIQHEDESKFEFSINKILIAILSIISIALIMFNTGDFIAKKMDENNRYSSNVEENFEYYKTRKMLSPLNYSYRVDYTKVLKEYSDTNRQILGDEKYNRIIDEVIYNLEFVFNTEHEIKSDIQKMYQILYECYSEKVTYDKSYKDKLENIQQYI